MQPLVIELFALLMYGTGIVVLHELGHLLFARLGGFRVSSFGIGFGKPLLRFQWRGGLVLGARVSDGWLDW